MERVRAHERALTAYMLERLAEVPGPARRRPARGRARAAALASFTIEGMHPHDIAELADRGGVCIRAGHHCAQPLMRCLGVGATARASVGVYNEPADIDALVDALLAGREVFGLVERLMDDLYRDYILEHYKRPRNFGELEPHDLEALEHNPLCGDELGVHIRVKDGRIEDLRFHGHGCAISQASASIASEELKGMDARARSASSDADWMIELLGIPVSATRRKCALLASLKVGTRRACTGDHTRWPTSDGRPLPRLHPRSLQAAAELRRAGAARPGGAEHNPLCGDELGVHIRVRTTASRICASTATAARSRRPRRRSPRRS